MMLMHDLPVVGAILFGFVLGWITRLILRGNISPLRLVGFSVATIGMMGLLALFSWKSLGCALAGLGLGLFVHSYLIAILRSRSSTSDTL